MTNKENIKAILACNFSGFKDECIETATNRIMETVNTTCPNCDSGYSQGYSDGYLKGKEERPHGEWQGGELGHCTNCGHKGCASDMWNGCTGMFCPNCGAKMDGGEEE